MILIEHDKKWKEGIRVLMLVNRAKDGAAPRATILRISTDAVSFDKCWSQLITLSHKNERIYASAGPRDIVKAARKFKERQLDSEYDRDPMDFYRGIDTRWKACLMSIIAQVKEEKVWLFDCDSEAEYELVIRELGRHYPGDAKLVPYTYPTREGRHILVQPFNRSKLSDEANKLLQMNPMMLWGYP